MSSTKPTDPEAIQQALAVPFPADEIQWKPQAVKDNRALAVAYIDARAVMDRLDAVLGVNGWQDEYTILAGGCVKCQLSVYFGPGRAVWREDVGGPSEQPDPGDKLKAAFSDALKRAAVKFGVGRYIYNLPAQWCDYDPQKKRFTRTPSLPAWALPSRSDGGKATGPVSPQGAVQAGGREPLAGPASETAPAQPEGTITAAQAAELAGLRKLAGVDWARFCVHYQLRQVEHLPVEHYEDAKRQLGDPKSALRGPLLPSQLAGWAHRWDAMLESRGVLRAGEFQEALRKAAQGAGVKEEDFALWTPAHVKRAEEFGKKLIQDRVEAHQRRQQAQGAAA